MARGDLELSFVTKITSPRNLLKALAVVIFGFLLPLLGASAGLGLRGERERCERRRGGWVELRVAESPAHPLAPSSRRENPKMRTASAFSRLFGLVILVTKESSRSPRAIGVR